MRMRPRLLGILTTFVFGALVVATFVVVAVPVHAQNSMIESQKAVVLLKKASTALTKASGADNRVAALTQAISAYEKGLGAMRIGLRLAVIRERVLRDQFDSQEDQISRLLGILQTLERATTPLLLIHPTGPVGTARSGMMLSEVAPSLQKQAEDLSGRLEELILLRSLQETAIEEVRLGLAGVQQARVELSQAIGARGPLPTRFADDPVRAQILADTSKTMKNFAVGLADIPFEEDSGGNQPFASAKGKLGVPTSGALLRGFNEYDAAGLQRPGILVAAKPLSLVEAPWDATIRYAGSFLDYGNVIILEPESGYLLVMAGMDQVYGEFGQIVSKGDAIGLLGGVQPQADEFLVDATQGGGSFAQETLYIELRKDGTAVDPVDWFVFGEI